jgi:hypothetical protein
MVHIDFLIFLLSVDKFIISVPWQTMRFGITLLVRTMHGKPASKFSFQPVPALDRHGVDVSRDDILQNLVSREDQLMNGPTPWRGPREKSTLLMQMLIQSSTSPGDVVLDCTAATGMLFQASVSHL